MEDVGLVTWNMNWARSVSQIFEILMKSERMIEVTPGNSHKLRAKLILDIVIVRRNDYNLRFIMHLTQHSATGSESELDSWRGLAKTTLLLKAASVPPSTLPSAPRGPCLVTIVLVLSSLKEYSAVSDVCCKQGAGLAGRTQQTWIRCRVTLKSSIWNIDTND